MPSHLLSFKEIRVAYPWHTHSLLSLTEDQTGQLTLFPAKRGICAQFKCCDHSAKPSSNELHSLI